MGSLTQYLQLYKPDIGETGWGEEVNQNFDTIDAKAKYVDESIQDLYGKTSQNRKVSLNSLPFLYILNPVASNTYYLLNSINCTALTTLQLTANRVYYLPFLAIKDMRVTAIAVYVSTATSSTTSVGIYTTSNYRPSTLLGSVSFDTSSTGLKTSSVSITLNARNLYWFGLASTSTPTLRAIPVGGITTLLGIVATGTAYTSHLYQSTTNGQLPLNANPTSAGTGAIPAVFVLFEYLEE